MYKIYTLCKKFQFFRLFSKIGSFYSIFSKKQPFFSIFSRFYRWYFLRLSKFCDEKPLF